MTFATTDKGDKLVCAKGDDGTNPNIVEISLATAGTVTETGTQTLTNKTLSAPTITGVLTATSAVFAGGSPLVFEGATANAYELTLAVTDPTADRTLTLPDETGNVATESFATAIAVALG